MTVSQRLYLAVVPAILGVFTVAALAYWGQYGKTAPHILVIVGVVASVGSLIVAWRNTRYVATRVTRLAAPAQMARTDELDTIEQEVLRLQRAVEAAELAQRRSETAADRSVHEYADLIEEAAAVVAQQLDEVRMPLHILLESRFGDLNENQEEMLAAARSAADDVHVRLDRLRAIANVDRGALRLRPERLRLNDIIAVLLPGLAATAARGGVAVASDVSPLQPAAMADRARLSEALSLLADDAVRRTPAGGDVRIVSVEAEAGGPSTGAGGAPSSGSVSPAAVTISPGGGLAVQLAISHGGGVPRGIDVALADRLIGAQGGRVEHGAERTVITLPADRMPSGLQAGVPRA
jgi:signal transduction histidine kinase